MQISSILTQHLTPRAILSLPSIAEPRRESRYILYWAENSS